MNPTFFNTAVLIPGLSWCHNFCVIPITSQAAIFLLSIAGQESNWEYRRQIGGPARSYFQCERGGGVRGVMTDPVTRDKFKAVTDSLDVPFYEDDVYEAIAWNDLLAVCLARLLVYSDPALLPTNEDDAWDYYERVWRPGKPDRSRWSVVYPKAVSIAS